MLKEAHLELVLEPIGTAANVEGDGVVQSTIEDGGGDNAIVEDSLQAPELWLLVKIIGPLLIATIDQLKEQVGAGPICGQIADFVDDQQAWHGIEFQPFIHSAFGHRLAQGNHHLRSGREQNAIAVLDRFQAEANCRSALVNLTMLW